MKGGLRAAPAQEHPLGRGHVLHELLGEQRLALGHAQAEQHAVTGRLRDAQQLRRVGVTEQDGAVGGVVVDQAPCRRRPRCGRPRRAARRAAGRGRRFAVLTPPGMKRAARRSSRSEWVSACWTMSARGCASRARSCCRTGPRSSTCGRARRGRSARSRERAAAAAARRSAPAARSRFGGDEADVEDAGSSGACGSRRTRTARAPRRSRRSGEPGGTSRSPEHVGRDRAGVPLVRRHRRDRRAERLEAEHVARTRPPPGRGPAPRSRRA